MASEPFDPRNLLDRLSGQAALESFYRHSEARERAILSRRLEIARPGRLEIARPGRFEIARPGRLEIARGEVLSVGSGWHPGRHLFPAPEFRLTAVDANPELVAHALQTGCADEAVVGYAGRLAFPPASFDVVLYRLVLHHLAYQGPLEPVFAEAARLLRPGGAMVAIEPGLWHPIGLALALANELGVATVIHGTPDDVPLSPRRLIALSEGAGLKPELHAVTYGWRRLPVSVQGALRPLENLGSRPRTARFGHTLMLIARA